MQGVFLVKCWFCLRAFLFFGVMAALLFSCGEGIRLLPFPVLESGQDEKSILRNAGQSDYHKNVLRLDAGDGGNFSKINRSGKDSPAGNFAEPGGLPVFRINYRLPVRAETFAEIFKSRFVALHLGSRAPPFF